MELSTKEYWKGLSFPIPGNLPDSGVEPVSPALAGGFLTTELPGKQAPHVCVCVCVCVRANNTLSYFSLV